MTDIYTCMYVCDSSGELKYNFPTKERNANFVSISHQNETIAANKFSKFLYTKYVKYAPLGPAFDSAFDSAFNAPFDSNKRTNCTPT